MQPKKVWMVVILCITLVALVSSQGWSESQGRFAGTTITVLGTASHRQYAPTLEKISEFEKQTGAKVNVVQLPSLDFHAKIMRDMLLKTGKYDVLEVPDTLFPSLFPYMASIDTFVRAQGIDLEEWKKQFAPWAISATTFHGELKFYTYYSGTPSGAYRKVLFEDPTEKAAFKQKYGYELAPPKTWKQLVDVASFFTRDTDGDGTIDQWGLIFSGSGLSGSNFFETFLFKSGLTHQDEEGYCMWGPKYPENQETVRKAAEFIVNLHRKWKVAPPAVIAMATSEVADFYMSGKAAMVIDLIYFMWDDIISPEVVARIGPSGEFRAPPLDEGGIPFHWAWGISEDSRHKEAAWEFLKWFLSDENIKLDIAKGIGTFIPTKLRLAKWGAEKGFLARAGVEEVAHAKFYPLHPATSDVRNAVIPAITEELQLGKITPGEFVEKTAFQLERLMLERGLLKKK